MITNERQYRISKAKAAEFLTAYNSLDKQLMLKQNIPLELIEAHRVALFDQYEQLQKQVMEYEALKSGRLNIASTCSLEELPEILIKSRIAQNLTQAMLAQKLGLSAQQIQRYEADMYSGASFKTLMKIADALGVELTAPATLSLAEKAKSLWERFPLIEMYKKGWFEGFCLSEKDAQYNSKELLTSFFQSVNLNDIQLALHRKKIRSNASVNEYSLLAWQAKLLSLCQKKPIETKFNRNLLTDSWFNMLVKKSASASGPAEVQAYLNEVGIYFHILPHLKKTHLDGATMMFKGNPVVGITLRHDRLDHFWFVLFHELGHVAQHLGKGSLDEFFDNLDENGGDSSSVDAMEREADQFALEHLIPTERWEVSPVRHFAREEFIRRQAEEWKISPALIAGRVRTETGNYTILNELVGYGKVRKLFPDIHFAQ